MDIVGATAKAVSLGIGFAEGLTDFVADEEIKRRIDRISTNLGPYGVDPFGYSPQYLKKAVGFGIWVYRRYFRCQTTGVQNVPEGRCFIVCNHSGQLPWDAMMINMAVFLEREPPRFPRTMIEYFVPALPFVSLFLTRCGQILGTPENCRRLLDMEAAIMVFPEGVRGLNKTWRDRYKLQRFGQGFMRLAIEKGAPIVPCSVIGAEEQAPSIYNAKRLSRMFGIPSLPITLSPLCGALPLPAKYRIRFGEPMIFEGDANDEDEVIMRKVDQVKSTLQRMIEEDLAAREAIFW